MIVDDADTKRAAIRQTVERACEGLQRLELRAPDDAGARAAEIAFEQALEKERQRLAKRKRRSRASRKPEADVLEQNEQPAA